MYLSRVAIDGKNRRAMQALENPEILHGMVESCFSGDRSRNLWRLDELQGNIYLLILSITEPNLQNIIKQIGFPDSEGEIKPYQRLLDRIDDGTVWRFRLAANPVSSIPQPGQQRGKVKAITVAERQREWIARQGEKHGFHLKAGQFDVVQSEWKIFRRQGKTLSILTATFEGMLTVTDKELFTLALLEGIGRGKAYGMGLLTVMSNG